MTLVIVDVGCGNIGSLRMAFERLGIAATISGDAAVIEAADRVVLPGVGAAGFAMDQIRARGLTDVLRRLRQPVLGVCLGMHLMFESSEEGDVETLGILSGHVRRLSAAPDRPVPHMGWSRLTVSDTSSGVTSGDYVYFAHSFAADDGPATVATADYGRAIPALVRSGNWLGTQFHPERSGAAGARVLEAFVAQ